MTKYYTRACNFFYGQSLTKKLKICIKLKSGCRILLHPVNKPELYGIANLNSRNKIINIVEKPKHPLTTAHKHAKIPYRVEEGNEDT